MAKIEKNELQEKIESKISSYFGVTADKATKEQMFKAVAGVVRDILTENRVKFKKKRTETRAKQVYYMSMEFLLGRSLKNHLFNLDLTAAMERVVSSYGHTLDELYEAEPDAGLGNGGLGRLAAAYMESLTNLNYVASGFSIKYEYGIFRQKIVDGWQTEFPDEWLENGEVWLAERAQDVFTVNFGGNAVEMWDGDRMRIEYRNSYSVQAVPYDMNISGYKTGAVNKLRLWEAKSPIDFDMQLFSKGEYVKAMENKSLAESISKVLYPADDHMEGKSLRLKQQYFFVSASLQSIIKKHLRDYGTLDNFADKVAIHINDTHPALCIPELMRLLLDEHGYGWDGAWRTVSEVMSYTNHTVMAEALEKWPLALFESLLPRIYAITQEIDRRFRNILRDAFPNDIGRENYNAIISDGRIKMANLCLAASHTVNGVSALHSDILKHDVFKDYYGIAPEKFTNVTNGITYRRWLAEANPNLTAYVKKLIGPAFLKDSCRLKDLEKFADDKEVLSNLRNIKLTNKKLLAKYIRENNGITVNPDSIFDVQVKRLHEYKRQTLNCMNIIDLYYRLKANPNLDINPRTFIFGAKAAPSYHTAKQIIRLINKLGDLINNDPAVNEKLKVVFLENYRVSLAEIVIPASDVSEQISIAGKEASGTGNMKFMINGAVTIGTMDGANIEIFENVGEENIFIFGLLASEAERLVKNGYEPTYYYQNNERIRAVIDGLRGGFAGTNFSDVASSLTTGFHGAGDAYMCLADFQSYADCQDRLDRAYSDRDAFTRKSLINIANSGFFSSDRSIGEYCDRIWKMKPIKI